MKKEGDLHVESWSKQSHVGLWGLLVKLGSKLLPAVAKLGKSVKVVKGVLIGTSFASYAYMFTWEFATMLMVMLFVHESGHIWAMKRYGMKTKGIYFIPFLGGAAVTESEFPSRKAEVVVAIMGPLWGFVLSLAAGAIYYSTQNPIFAAASSWMAMINLFNLLPINPLDGGRVFKSIAFSIHSKLGFAFLVFGLAASVVIAHYANLGLFIFLLIIGSLDLAYEYWKGHPKKKQSRDALINKVYEAERGASDVKRDIRRFEEEIRLIDNAKHVEGCRCAETREELSREVVKLRSWLKEWEKDVWNKRKEAWGHSLDRQRRSLSTLEIAGSAAAYMFVTAILWGLMFSMHQIPGADIAMKVLTG